MPKLFINYPERAFPEHALDALAEEITTTGLQCESCLTRPTSEATFGFISENTPQTGHTTAENQRERRH